MNATTTTSAMLWKEIRENLKWAALGLLGTTGGLVYALWNHRGMNQPSDGDYVHSGSPLLSDECQAVTIIASAAVGLLLALAQIFPEKRPDQWAFLVHRPVSRTRLFWHKVLAGALLYLLAVGVPYACAVARVAKPGNVPAPFVPGLVLPGLADILMGFLYYFAGMIVALRDARWYGSRILAAGLAVFCSFVVVIGFEFWWAMLAIIFGGAILATAAWGSFTTGGRDEHQPMPAKASLGVAVFMGIVMLGGTCVAVLAHVLFSQSYPYERHEHSTYTMTKEGEVVRVNYRGSAILSITDPQGNPIPKYASITDAKAREEALGGMPGVTIWLNPRQAIGHRLSYRQQNRYFLNLAAPTVDKWYYRFDERYLVGYNQRDRRVSGYAGPTGFRRADQGAPAERFEGEMLPAWQWPTHLIAFSSGAYSIDYLNRNIATLFVPPQADEALVYLGIAQTSPPPTSNESPVTLFSAFATTSSIYVNDPDGKRLYATPLLYPPKTSYEQVSIYHSKNPERNVVWYHQRYNPFESSKLNVVTHLSPTGEVLARREFPPIARTYPRPTNVPELTFIGAMSPPIAMGSAVIAQSELRGAQVIEICRQPDVRAGLAASIASAMLCAGITFAIGRRYTFSTRRLVGWTIGNLLLGPAGLLTLIAIGTWPARETCPACGRSRTVDRERCPHCGGEFAMPALDGTEIFAT